MREEKKLIQQKEICTIQWQFTKSKMLSQTFLINNYVFIVYLSITIQTHFGVRILQLYNIQPFITKHLFQNLQIIC